MSYCMVEDVAKFLTQSGFDTDTMPSGAVVEMNIRIASAEIDMSLQTSDQLLCQKSTAGLNYLQLLNIIAAVLITEYDNARYLSDADLARLQAWKDNQMTLIRTGQLSICLGETGIDYPAISTAEVGYTPDAQALIVLNRIRRNADST